MHVHSRTLCWGGGGVNFAFSVEGDKNNSKGYIHWKIEKTSVIARYMLFKLLLFSCYVYESSSPYHSIRDDAMRADCGGISFNWWYLNIHFLARFFRCHHRRRLRRWTTYSKQSFNVSIFIRRDVVAATWLDRFMFNFLRNNLFCVFRWVSVAKHIVFDRV